jgi:hypothetical protein
MARTKQTARKCLLHYITFTALLAWSVQRFGVAVAALSAVATFRAAHHDFAFAHYLIAPHPLATHH